MRVWPECAEVPIEFHVVSSYVMADIQARASLGNYLFTKNFFADGKPFIGRQMVIKIGHFKFGLSPSYRMPIEIMISLLVFTFQRP